MIPLGFSNILTNGSRKTGGYSWRVPMRTRRQDRLQSRWGCFIIRQSLSRTSPRASHYLHADHWSEMLWQVLHQCTEQAFLRRLLIFSGIGCWAPTSSPGTIWGCYSWATYPDLCSSIVLICERQGRPLTARIAGSHQKQPHFLAFGAASDRKSARLH